MSSVGSSLLPVVVDCDSLKSSSQVCQTKKKFLQTLILPSLGIKKSHEKKRKREKEEETIRQAKIDSMIIPYLSMLFP